jgi:hypothetical protein
VTALTSAKGFSMQVASRPYATAGIALVGASAIAISPIKPPLPDIHLPSLAQVAASVELAAESLAATPITYAQVFQQAVTNLQAILSTAAANPTPILTKVLSNQIATVQALLALLPTTAAGASNAALANPTTNPSQLATSQPGAFQDLVTAIQTFLGQVSTALTTTDPPLLQSALGDLTSGEVEGAINNLLTAALAPVFPLTGLIPPLLAATVTDPLQAVVNQIDTLGPIGTILSNPLQNVVNAVNAVQVGGVLSPLSLAVTGLLGPVLSGAGAFGAAVDNVIHAGDPQDVLNAVVNGPAVILNGVLNGGFGPNLASFAGLPPDLVTVFAGGLLSGGPAVIPGGVLTIQLPGPISSLQALAKAIADAIAPPAPATADLKSSTLAAPAALPAAPSALPAAPSKTVTLTTGSTAASAPAKTTTSADSAQKPEDAADGTTDTTKDSSSASANGAESTSATKDSTAADSTDASGVTKPTDKGTDVTTGNKVEPGSKAGSGATKGDSGSSTTSDETTTEQAGTASAATSDGADKGAGNGAHTASHGRHAK